jgi:hypothetical protein
MLGTTDCAALLGRNFQWANCLQWNASTSEFPRDATFKTFLDLSTLIDAQLEGDPGSLDGCLQQLRRKARSGPW